MTQENNNSSSTNMRPLSSSTSNSNSGSIASKHNLTHYSTSILQTKNFTTFPVGSNHIVTNIKLDELLIMYSFMKSSTMHHASMSIDQEHTVILKAREEINLNIEELHLSNSSFGPLIIPGPTISSTTNATTSIVEEVEDHDESKLFNYQGTWKVLSKSYLKDGEYAIHPRVLEIKKLRANTILNVIKLSLYNTLLNLSY